MVGHRISGRLGRFETVCLVLLVVTKIILQAATGFLTYPVATCILFIAILFIQKYWKLIGVVATMLPAAYLPVKSAYNRLHDCVAYSAATQIDILFCPLSSLDRFAIAMGVAFPLFHQESNVSLLAGNLLGILLLMTLVFRLSDWLSRTLGPANPSTEASDAT